MAMIETWVKCELKKAVQVQYLQGNLFSLDNQGNLVGVEVFDEGEPASLSGTVSANVIRADGGTVAVSGTLSGNKCYVVLPQAAYQVPGVVTIVIKLTASSVVTTLAAVVTTVYRSSTETAVDPGTIISDINTLIAEIDAAVASIPADYSSLWTSLAPAYSTSSTYAVGQYVTYNGGLYRCTTAITSGESWTSGHWTAAKLGPDISDLKSALITTEGVFGSTINEENVKDYASWFVGYFNASGTRMSNSSYLSTEMFSVPVGSRIVAIINETASSSVESISIREYNASTKARTRIEGGSSSRSVMMENIASDKVYNIQIMGTSLSTSDADITLLFVSDLNDNYTNVERIKKSIGAVSEIAEKDIISGYTTTSKKVIDSSGLVKDIAYDTNQVTSKIDCSDIFALFITGSFSSNSGRYSIAFYDDFNNCLQVRRFQGETGNTEVTDYYVEVPVRATNFIVGTNYAPGTSTNDLPLVIKKIGVPSIFSPCYVATTGSDSNDGRTASTPLKSIQKAVDLGHKKIIVSPGKYQEQISLINLNGVEILCSVGSTENVFDDDHVRMARVKIDNSVDVELSAYDTIYRASLSLSQDSSYYKVFVGQSLPVIYDGSDYYGRRDTYNAILWEVTGESKTTQQLVPVLSEASCKSTEGTFYYDGSYVYVNPFGGTITGKTYKRLNLDAKQTGITIDGSSDIILDGIDACYFPYNNIAITNSKNITLKNCDSICSCYHNGVKLHTVSCDFHDCKSIRAGADGYGIGGSGNCSFYNCCALYCGDDGVSHHDATEGMVDGGIWEGNLKGGITPSYGARINVKDVLCRGNDYGIYYVQSSSDRHTEAQIVISNCLSVGNTTKDISIGNGYKVIGYNCVYQTKEAKNGGVFTEYNNAVVN